MKTADADTTPQTTSAIDGGTTPAPVEGPPFRLELLGADGDTCEGDNCLLR